MSPEEIRSYFNRLIKDFSDPKEHANAVDIDIYDHLSIEEIDKIDLLKRFYGFDEDGPYSEFLNKGLKSLRQGFYKICKQPFYNTYIYPKTFSASVYYFHPNFPTGKLIKYEANIGPITNIHAVYHPVIGTLDDNAIPLIKTFKAEKNSIGTPEDHYLKPKTNFYNEVFKQNKIFWVEESIFDPEYLDSKPKPKKVTWSFIN